MLPTLASYLEDMEYAYTNPPSNTDWLYNNVGLGCHSVNFVLDNINIPCKQAFGPNNMVIAFEKPYYRVGNHFHCQNFTSRVSVNISPFSDAQYPEFVGPDVEGNINVSTVPPLNEFSVRT